MPIPIHNQYYFKFFVVREEFGTGRSVFTQLTLCGMGRNFQLVLKVFVLIQFLCVHERGPGI
jgi:hypothetical protein